MTSSSFLEVTTETVQSNNSGIKFLYFNVRSLLPKIDDLRLVCSLYFPHVICIVESWLDIDILDSEICIQGYLCRLDRTRHGGGTIQFM